MTVRKGEAWGSVGPPPVDLVTVADDQALHRLVDEHRRRGRVLPAVAPASGDLLRALGGSGDPARRTGDMAILPVDVVRVEADGEQAWFVSHLLARRSWWRGPVVAVMNGQYLGPWDVAPRAHPGDGRADLVVVDRAMSVRDRWSARGRAVHGLHLPHPSIRVSQHAVTTVRLAPGARIWLDGHPWRRADEITVTVEADALTVCI